MSNVIGQDSIVFNQSNLVSGTTNQYQYNFPGGKNFKNDKVAIKAISLYYSWKNITKAYGNNVFTIVWPITASSSTVTTTANYVLTIPDGNYSIAQLNTEIEQFCINNSLYLISSNGTYNYYISCQTNSNYYSVEFDFFPIPDTALQTTNSLTQPSGWPTSNTYASAFTPQIIVPTATTINSFSTLIGYLPATYPTTNLSTVNVGIQSTFAPQVSPVKSIIVGCNLVSNSFGQNNSVIGTFAYSNTTFGQLINYSPAFGWYANLLDGSFNSMIITFWDQSFNALPIYDTNVTIELSLVATK